MNRPYLIIPQLIEQSTWGGDYIVRLKNWSDRPSIARIRIGQSYELSGASQLATDITDSTDPRFNHTGDGFDHVPLTSVLAQSEHMPLLIKVNQALGNSFQLHIKPETKSDRWKPKPESWYFLEDGYISLGVIPGRDMNEYKRVCHDIHNKMLELSLDIKRDEKTVSQSLTEAHTIIRMKNPWHYVNLYDVKQYDLIDLSMGGIHHSWEEDTSRYPLGNIVFEVQLDASDDESTIRSFDQGKIKDDGTVRKLDIDEYFQHLDTDPTHNSLEYMRRKQEGQQLLRTRFYSVDILEITAPQEEKTTGSFQHLYVRDGDVSISAGDTTIRVTKGHSCFIPSSVQSYTIQAHMPGSVVLKTFIS